MAPTSRTPPRRLPRNVWALGLTSFLNDVSSEMVLNLLPLFLANVLGVRTSLIGAIEGLAEAASSLVKVGSGWLSDRLGRRKWLTVSGYALSAATKPLLYFTTGWGGVLGVRLADRLGKGIRTAPRDALIADSIGPTERGLAFGVHRAADTAGAFVGLTLALAVVWAAQSGLATLEWETFRTVVLLSIVPGALAVLCVVLAVRDVPRPAARPAARRPSLSLAGFDRRFKGFLIVVVVFTLGNSSDAFLVLRAQERGLNVLQVMGMLITFAAVYTLVSVPAGALSDRIGRNKLLVGGWLMYGAIYLGFAAARSGGQAWALYALYGVYHGMVEGTARAFVADLVTPERRGTAYGLFNAAVGLTAFPASLIAGLLWQGIGGFGGFGPAAPFWFGAVMALLAVALLVFWLPRLGPENDREAAA